jgi:hypothetical protein
MRPLSHFQQGSGPIRYVSVLHVEFIQFLLDILEQLNYLFLCISPRRSRHSCRYFLLRRDLPPRVDEGVRWLAVAV